MIEQILPAQVASVEAFDDAGAGELFAEEQASLGDAAARRATEFATVRTCARRALTRLGVSAVPIVRGRGGAPRWPAGIVGSMTHCRGYRAASVAHAVDIVTVGIDAEIHEPVADGVLPYIASVDERAQLQSLSRREPHVHWERVLFSAKESVYKAWFPLTSRWLDFSEAVVTIDPDRGRFSTRLLVTGPTWRGDEPVLFDGRWLVRDGLVVTAVVVGN
ncbi:MAG TPA: 4'-phosphopantetheinyl transferase superfamily protein [Jatrophihabitantaceae bacterium]|jgi:4'-phosphopantetheinyl transferase EntD